MKETLDEMIARRTFESPDMQKSWKEHMDVFGPIMGDAFREDYSSRVYLTQALNLMSRTDTEAAFKKLRLIEPKCCCAADLAAWFYFMGLCYEFCGQRDMMLKFYQQAGVYEHHFYLPYMKVAKFAYLDAAYDISLKNYHLAIGCFREDRLQGMDTEILASLYTNMGSCLTMMHRFDEAHEALDHSSRLQSVQPGREAFLAILAAAEGKKDELGKYLELMRKTPKQYEQLKQQTDAIISGQHPQFSVLPVDDGKISEFWTWFEKNRQELADMIKSGNTGQPAGEIQTRLTQVFPFLWRAPDMAFGPEENRCSVRIADSYMEALRAGCEKLIAACPDSVSSDWNFVIAH